MQSIPRSYTLPAGSFHAGFPVIILFVLTMLASAASARADHDGDSLRLAQCYANLSLSVRYFDSLPDARLAKMIAYFAEELSSIQDNSFLKANDVFYRAAVAQLQLLKLRLALRGKAQASRQLLLQCKANRDSANANWKNSMHLDEYNSYYRFAGFSQSFGYVYSAFLHLDDSLDIRYGRDVYPDYQRLFYAMKNDNRYAFDSLRFYAGLYDLHIDSFVRINRAQHQTPRKPLLPLYLISQFIQFSYIIQDNAKSYNPRIVRDAYKEFMTLLNPAGDTSHGVYPGIPKDEFFRKEMSASVCTDLYNRLNKRFRIDTVSEIHYPPPPVTHLPTVVHSHEHGTVPLILLPTPVIIGGGTRPIVPKPPVTIGGHGKPTIIAPPPPQAAYYFPVPAPFPSCKYAISHFMPNLQTMKEVNNYIRTSFDEAGYDGRLHYYYTKDPGFAVATDLERINKDGSPAKGNERWNLKMTDDDGLSLYQVFKSIFFATESDFRMMACVVAPREIETGSSRDAMSAAQMGALIRNSYSALPADLESTVLPDKTITILVYHFNQSDVGEVPQLASSDNIVVPQHFMKTPPLQQLIK